MRVAINGMGRIGRLLFRKLADHPQIELVAVNDIMPAENLVYLLKYDSIYGTFDKTITLEQDYLSLPGNKKIRVLQADHPSALPWRDMQVDVVLECSGRFTKKPLAELHLQSGAKKVLLSTTGSDDIPLKIFGFNQNGQTPGDIISPGGCMTNCSVHILYILQAIGIRSAQLNILHSYTSRQELVDAPHPHFRRGRAASESIIPVEIDLHLSIERLMPGLKGRVAAVSTRVPVANGAMADFSVVMNDEISAKEINNMFKKAAEHEFKGIVGYTEDPLVSLDIKGNTHSCLIDGTLTSVVGNHLKLIAWFDNEYGFTSRMVDWLEYWQTGKA